MALIKTSNPALSSKTFTGLASAQYGGAIDAANRMTLSGTVNKTGLLLICAIATAVWTWSQYLQSRNPADVMPMMLAGLFGGLIFSMVTIFKKEWSPVTAPIYALLEGLVLGGLSAIIDQRYPGIAIQAVGLTFGTLFVLLLAYSSGLIKVTQKFRLGVIAATGGIMVFYLLGKGFPIANISLSSVLETATPACSASPLMRVALPERCRSRRRCCSPSPPGIFSA
jgi:uncharacterized YccA/Bax inhibitor family protein